MHISASCGTITVLVLDRFTMFHVYQHRHVLLAVAVVALLAAHVFIAVHVHQRKTSTKDPAGTHRVTGCMPSTHSERWPTQAAIQRWDSHPPDGSPFVAIVLCATAKKVSPRGFDEMAIARLLIPSVLQTAEPDAYRYELFVGIDHDDVFWQSHHSHLEALTLTMPVHVHAFSTPDNHIPMNEILSVAASSGAEYLVRVNDDTEFVTANWTTYGINALAAFDPPNVGVVGPICKQGNTAILTHDMVHRTHLDIFRGVYYPEIFGNWWLDDWISRVYGPSRTVKLSGWEVLHHVCHHGTRYGVMKPPEGAESTLYRELKKGTDLINRWLWATYRLAPPKVNLLVYSLYGTTPQYTDGIIANARLHHTVYPGWSMRVYHDRSVPAPVLSELQTNGVELTDMTGSSVPSGAWRLLAASDVKVGRFCSRNADSRLTVREKLAVDAWVSSDAEFHVMRDHPSHSAHDMLGGLWCATHAGFPEVMHQLLTHRTGLFNIISFLHNEIFPIAQNSVLQHDSFSCDKFGGGVPFPSPRIGWEHVGGVYIDNELRQGDVDILKAAVQPAECTVVGSRAPWDAVSQPWFSNMFVDTEPCPDATGPCTTGGVPSTSAASNFLAYAKPYVTCTNAPLDPATFESPPPGRAATVIDVTKIAYDVDTLEIRLYELAPVVNYFIVIESTTTDRGDPKPMFFDPKRFAGLGNRLRYVVHTGFASVMRDRATSYNGDEWVNENAPREAALEPLAALTKTLTDPILIHSGDTDEFLSRETLGAAVDAALPPDAVVCAHRRLTYTNVAHRRPAVDDELRQGQLAVLWRWPQPHWPHHACTRSVPGTMFHLSAFLTPVGHVCKEVSLAEGGGIMNRYSSAPSRLEAPCSLFSDIISRGIRPCCTDREKPLENDTMLPRLLTEAPDRFPHMFGKPPKCGC